jgi:GNAT superfamily N-acetyltransferase
MNCCPSTYSDKDLKEKCMVVKVNNLYDWERCCALANRVSLEITGNPSGGFMGTEKDENYRNTYMILGGEHYNELYATFVFEMDSEVDEIAYPLFERGQRCVNFIHKMVVREDMRRKGLGRLILDYCTEQSEGFDLVLQIMVHPYFNIANMHNAIGAGFNMVDSTWYIKFGMNCRYVLFCKTCIDDSGEVVLDDNVGV